MELDDGNIRHIEKAAGLMAALFPLCAGCDILGASRQNA
jgi:hypothetical protein